MMATTASKSYADQDAQNGYSNEVTVSEYQSEISSFRTKTPSPRLSFAGSQTFL